MASSSLKPGFHPHHNENCNIELKRTPSGNDWYGNSYPNRSYWCHTHYQWCTEWPVKVIWEFEDGTQLIKTRPSNVD